MRSVADSLRKEIHERSRCARPAERVALAIDLGLADLEAYRRAHRLETRAAITELRRRRQIGRQRSVSMEAR